MTGDPFLLFCMSNRLSVSCNAFCHFDNHGSYGKLDLQTLCLCAACPLSGEHRQGVFLCLALAILQIFDYSGIRMGKPLTVTVGRCIIESKATEYCPVMGGCPPNDGIGCSP